MSVFGVGAGVLSAGGGVVGAGAGAGAGAEVAVVNVLSLPSAVLPLLSATVIRK